MGEFKPRRTKKYLAEVDKFILAKMINGDSQITIIDYLVENENMTPDNARFRIDQVLKKVSEADKMEIEEKASKYREMYTDLYKKALLDDNHLTAKAILDSLVKMDGLLVQKIEAKIDGDITVTFD